MKALYDQHFQAMGLSAMSAMASGVSVIVPKESGCHSYAKHEESALFVDTVSRDACIEGLERLIMDTELRRSIAQRGISDICKYSPEIASFRILSVLFPQ